MIACKHSYVDIRLCVYCVHWQLTPGFTCFSWFARQNPKPHNNRLLEDVKEMWTEASKGGKGKARGAAINKDRYVSKMFLRGDSVILIVSNPAAALNGGGGGGGASKAGGKESRSEGATATASGGGDDQ
jgi:LSM domain